MNNAQILRKKLFTLQSAVLALFCLAVVAGVSVTLYRHLVADLEYEFFLGAKYKAEAVSQWANRAQDLARQITSRSRIRQELKKYNQGVISLDRVVEFTSPKLDDAIRISKEVVGVSRLDAKGIAFVRLGILPPQDAISVSLPLSKSVSLGNLFTRKGEKYLWVRAPIIDRQNNVVGADVVVLTTEKLANVIECDDSDELGHGSGVYFLVAQGQVEVLFASKCAATNTGNESVSSILKSIRNRTVNQQRVKFYLKGLFCVAIPVENSNWTMIACLNKDQSIIPIMQQLIVMLPLVLVLYALCLMGYWLALRPLAQRMLIKQSELESEVESKTAALQTELTARKQAEEEKDQLIRDLEDALKQIKQLGGLLPICASCKKIRDDQGYWRQVEDYISTHSEAEFTHGICPECRKKLYPELK